jgi:hypothetical protein
VDLFPHQSSPFLQELQKGTDEDQDIPLPVMKSFRYLSMRCSASSAAFLSDLRGQKNSDPRKEYLVPKK